MTLDTDAVFIEFHRRLRAFVSRRVKSAADAEDVVQETFIRIHRSLPSLRNADRVSSWVFEIARNAIGDHYRHRLRGNAGGSQAGTAREQAAARPEIESDLEPLAACLSPMIAALPPLDRQAVEMAEVQGLSQREAAARAGVTLSGMKSRVQRARRKLEAMLRECCRIELDRRGGIVGHEPRTSPCGPCRTRTPGPRPLRRERVWKLTRVAKVAFGPPAC